MDESDELFRRCQQGDERALGELVRSYQDRIFRLAFRVTGNATLAEEATAQALVKIWDRAGQWRGQARASTWIYRLAVRTVLDVQRSQRRWWRRWSGPWPRLFRDPAPGPTEQLDQVEEQHGRTARVQQALAQLSDSDRALVVLYYFENHGLVEIEAILGVPRTALKMRLARARERLRSLLRDRA